MMLTFVIFAGVVAVVLILSLFGFRRVRRGLVAHTEHLTPYTEQHGRDLERRLERLVTTSHEQTSTLQNALESLRAGRRNGRDG
jgi:hypothetical protein